MKLFCIPLFIFVAQAQADSTYTCDYAYMGMPTTSIRALIYADGNPSESVEVTVQGRSHKESAMAETIASDESVHLWISKESAENSIEMIVYLNRKAGGNSKLVNHHVPFAQEMWGECMAAEPAVN